MSKVRLTRVTKTGLLLEIDFQAELAVLLILSNFRVLITDSYHKNKERREVDKTATLSCAHLVLARISFLCGRT